MNKSRAPQQSSSFLRTLIKLIIPLLIIGGIFFVREKGNRSVQEDQNLPQTEQESSQGFPDLENPRETDYSWNFEGEEYEVDMTLYDSVNEYYDKQPKEHTCYGSCPPNWREEYYNMFLEVPEEDNTFSRLASKLEKIGTKRRLSEDQVLETAVAFVQSIPYDEAKAVGKPRYPYEVLYDKKGVCGGKSLLGALLAEELGYGVALFSYEKENHMAIGIKCPDQYSSYNSGYCFTELTTMGWKIGIRDLGEIETISPTRRAGSLETAPVIYEVAEGQTYRGVSETIRKKNRMLTLKEELDQLEERIQGLKKKLEYYESTNDYSAYNDLVPVYNDVVAAQRKKVEEYNDLVEYFGGE